MASEWRSGDGRIRLPAARIASTHSAMPSTPVVKMKMTTASAADVVALLVEARKRVRDQFGVELELEVELRGEWGTGTA